MTDVIGITHSQIPTSPLTQRHLAPLTSKPKTIGMYKLGRTLGEGTYGKVKLGTHVHTGQEVAIKIMRPSESNNKAEVEREIAILKLLKHPNIVQLFEVIEEPQPMGRVYLVLELVSGGELFDYIVARGRVKEKEARRFFRQIISGVEYCHSNLVVHRDLKPENLLLDADGNVKINDFGFSNIIAPGKLFRTFCGSPIYAPPEIILEKEYIGPAVDIWSMGVILYALVNGQLPWRLGKNGRIIDIEKLLAGQYESPSANGLSKSVKDLMSIMIVPDPKKRATLAEVRLHPWICEGYDGPPPCLLLPRPPVREINENVLEQLVLMGFDKDITRAALRTNESSPAVTVYHLLLEKAPAPRKMVTPAIDLTPTSPLRSKVLTTPFSPKVQPLVAISEDGDYKGEPITTPPLSAERERPTSPVVNITPIPQPARRRANTITNLTSVPILPNAPPPTPAAAVTPAPLSTPASPTISGSDGISSSAPIPRRRNSILSMFRKNDPKSVVVAVAPAPGTADPVGSPVNGPPGAAPGGRGHRRRLSFQDTIDMFKPTTKTPGKKEPKLREIKGVFNVDTTTLKPAEQVVAEVVRVLTECTVDFKQKGYVFRCKQKNVEKSERLQFEIEICQIQGLSMNGVRFKRTSGGVWNYRTMCQTIMQKMKL